MRISDWSSDVCSSDLPGVFGTIDVGAPRTLGIYFMYDVKQYDPAEWSSPPLEGKMVERPGFGQAIMGRGAVNQKGPEATFLAALHAIRAAGRKLPVNRSEERRVGKECVRTWRTRGEPEKQ